MHSIFSVQQAELWAVVKERHNAILSEMEYLRRTRASQAGRPRPQRRAADRMRRLLGVGKRRLFQALTIRPK